MYRVVIASGAEDRDDLVEALESTGRFQVAEVTDHGIMCVRAAMAEQPDLVIVDLMLREIDGLEVLERLGKLKAIPPKSLALCGSEPLRRQALAAGASQGLVAPWKNLCVAESALRLVVPPEEYFSDQAVERQFWAICQKIGAPITMRGFACAVAGIRLVFRDRTLLDKMMDRLYPAIRDAVGARNVSTVDKRLRDFVKGMLTRGDLAALEAYFGGFPGREKASLTNSAFFSVMAKQVLFALQERREREVRASF